MQQRKRFAAARQLSDQQMLAVDTEPGSLVIQLNTSRQDFFQFCAVAKRVTFNIPLQLDQNKTS